MKFTLPTRTALSAGDRPKPGRLMSPPTTLTFDSTLLCSRICSTEAAGHSHGNRVRRKQQRLVPGYVVRASVTCVRGLLCQCTSCERGLSFYPCLQQNMAEQWSNVLVWTEVDLVTVRHACGMAVVRMHPVFLLVRSCGRTAAGTWGIVGLILNLLQ